MLLGPLLMNWPVKFKARPTQQLWTSRHPVFLENNKLWLRDGRPSKGLNTPALRAKLGISFGSPCSYSSGSFPPYVRCMSVPSPLLKAFLYELILADLSATFQNSAAANRYVSDFLFPFSSATGQNKQTNKPNTQTKNILRPSIP